MANRSTLKEAMAEALAIRDTAIENAQDQLKESLTPHFKNLLAAKLREMDEEEMDEEVISEEEVEEAAEDVEESEFKNANKKPVAEADDDSDESEEEADDEESAPEDVPDDMPDDEETEDEEDDIEVKDMEVEDLKDMIRDILAQEIEGGMGEPGDDYEEDEYGDDAPVDDVPMDDEPEDMVGAEDDEIDLTELLRELEALANESADSGEEVAEEVEDLKKEARKPAATEESTELETIREELKGVYAEVDKLKASLKESAIFSAKLLYLNKVFKKYNLTESQKVTVVAAFDKAESKRDAELIYETVLETYTDVAKSKRKRTALRENRGFASKSAGRSTKPKGDVITEASEVVKRMQKLAGIITE